MFLYLGMWLCRKPVVLYTTSPLVASLGERVDPLRRLGFKLVWHAWSQGAVDAPAKGVQAPDGSQVS